MKNYYETNGEVTKVFLNHRAKGQFATLIDTEDLPKIKEFPNNWNVNFQNSDHIYVVTTLGGQSFRMHRIINECPTDKMVDHINGNTLDNRKANLRNVTGKENQQNRSKGAQRNSKSGIRGVCWVGQRNKWRADIKVDGKRIYLGLFDTKEEAEREAVVGRKQFMNGGVNA